MRRKATGLIVKVAKRLLNSVLQKDAGLLIHYDNALMRGGAAGAGKIAVGLKGSVTDHRQDARR